MSADLPTLGIGVDIGGTSTKAAVIDALGTVRRLDRAADRARRRGRGVHRDARRRSSVADAAGVSVSDVDAIGVGIPGTVDPQRGTVRLRGQRRHRPRRHRARCAPGRRARRRRCTSRTTSAPRRSAPTGTCRTSTAPVNDLAYLSIGTGIAAGYVERGQLRRGNSLVAGEIGHIPIDPQGPLCACGQIGCIEAIASGSAIERMWPTENGVVGRRAASRRDRRRPGRGRLWAGVIGGLSRAVLLLALTWDPEVIVLSGGVASLGDVLRDAIAERLAADAQQSEFLGSLDLGATDAGDRSVGRARADRRGPRRARRRAVLLAMTSLAIRGGVVHDASSRVHVRGRRDRRRSRGSASVRAPSEPARAVVDAIGLLGAAGLRRPAGQRRGRCRPDDAAGADRRGRGVPRGMRCHVVHADRDLLVGRPDDRQRSRRSANGRRSAAAGARSLGIHLEGPFLNPARAGAHPPHHLRPPSLAEVRGLAPRGRCRDGHPRTGAAGCARRDRAAGRQRRLGLRRPHRRGRRPSMDAACRRRRSRRDPPVQRDDADERASAGRRRARRSPIRR